MKKCLAVFAVLGALALGVIPATAGTRWTWKEVKWRTPGFTAAGQLQVHDTSFAHVGPVGLADTSAWTSLEKSAYLNTSDSLVATAAAYWVFASDTAAAYTATLTALTVATDVGSPILSNATTDAIQVQAVSSTVDGGASYLVTTGNKIVAYPIFLGGSPGTSFTQGAVAAFPIRCRVTAGVGAQGLAQARVFLVYPTDASSP